MERILIFKGTRLIGTISFEWADEDAWTLDMVTIAMESPNAQQIVEDAAYHNMTGDIGLHTVLAGGVTADNISRYYDGWREMLPILSEWLADGWTIVWPRTVPVPTLFERIM